MTKTTLVRAVLMLFAGAALLGAGYFAGTRHAGDGFPTSAAAPSMSAAGDKIDPKTGRKVLY